MQSPLLKLAILLAQPLVGTAATFRPERDGLQHEGLVRKPTHSLFLLPYQRKPTHALDNQTDTSSPTQPTHLHPAVSQAINQTHNLPSPGSFWSSSFIHASNNHSYLVLSHLLPSIAIYRASVLDITDPAHYAHTADGISELRTWSARPEDGVEFNLTFSTSAPILLNGGLGFFESRNSTVYEWSMPAGLMRGWIAVNGTRRAR
ncbi:Kievitone hydratase [Colletotrichum tropicale]|nr:Kievitone hydratase [Colletotrichum tropicale]